MRVVSSLESRGLLSVDRTGRHNRYRIVLSDVTGDILSQVTSETRQVTSETRQVTSETATGVVDVTLSIKEPLEPPVVTPPTPPRSLQDSSFEEFWTFYPRKVGKPDARRAYVGKVSFGRMIGAGAGAEGSAAAQADARCGCSVTGAGANVGSNGRAKLAAGAAGLAATGADTSSALRFPKRLHLRRAAFDCGALPFDPCSSSVKSGRSG